MQSYVCYPVDNFENVTTQNLRSKKTRVPIGVGIDFDEIDNYPNEIANNFDLLIPKNDMKMAYLHPRNTSQLTFSGSYDLRQEYKILKGQPTPGYTSFNFTAGYSLSDYEFNKREKYLQFAKRNNMNIRFHVLVYHVRYQVPMWLRNTNITKNQAICAIMRHTYNIVNYYKTNYPGVINSYDVVAEHLDINGVPWCTGSNDIEYIIASFIAAKKADPNVKLFYNDYNMERANRSDTNSRLYRNYTIIKNINDNYPGLIDGVGFQGHIGLDFAETTNINSRSYIKNISDYMKSTIIPNIEMFTKLGLEVQLTEFDISIFNRRNLKYWGSNNETTWNQTAITNYHTVYAELITQLYTYFNTNPQCTAFCFYGFIDQKSWIYNRSSSGEKLNGLNKPLLFDMNPKTKAITPKLNYTIFKNRLLNI